MRETRGKHLEWKVTRDRVEIGYLKKVLECNLIMISNIMHSVLNMIEKIFYRND